MKIYEKITHAVFLELVELLGEEKDFILNSPSFSIKTDRTDDDLCSNVIDFYSKINKISKIIKCEPSDFKISFCHDESDHEFVTQKILLNFEYPFVGAYQLFNNDLYIVLKEDLGVYTIQSLNGNVKYVNQDYLSSPSWDQIFFLRDNLNPEDIY